MPMQSEAQRRYLWAKHPDVAREFEAATPKGARLPEKVDHRRDAAKELVKELEKK